MRILPSIIAAAILLAGCSQRQPEPKVTPYEELHDTERLCLAEMAVGKVGKISDQRLRDATSIAQGIDAALNHLKIGDRVAIYSFDTYIAAYLDLSQLRPDDVTVDEKTRTCHVTLPPIEIECLGRDMKLQEEHYRVTGLRSQISPEERAALKEEMSRAVAAEIAGDRSLRDRLTETARAKARSFVSLLLAEQGYTTTVDFR